MHDEIDCDLWSFAGTQAGEVRSQQRTALGQAATPSLAEVSQSPQSTALLFLFRPNIGPRGFFIVCTSQTSFKSRIISVTGLSRICAHCADSASVLCSFPAPGERALRGKRGLQRSGGRAAFRWLSPPGLPDQSGWPPPQSDARATPQGKRLGQAQRWWRSQRGGRSHPHLPLWRPPPQEV